MAEKQYIVMVDVEDKPPKLYLCATVTGVNLVFEQEKDAHCGLKVTANVYQVDLDEPFEAERYWTKVSWPLDMD
jgi:hypothetical protein